VNDKGIFKQLAIFQKNSKVSCLATIINTEGSTPREVGAKMIVCSDGSSYGTIGGGCGEKQVLSAAIRCLLEQKKPEIVEVDLSGDLGVKGADVCGGKMLVFIEPFIP
jgi:xanthine/CO dehydrogenase XdhC/CoxF family maturation factor